MNQIILQATATAQWHALITEASNKCAAKLSEDIESYLVFLLMRFINSPAIFNRIMALELLSSCQHGRAQQQHSLQAVGDCCLLFAGLFPGLARRRRVRISYYIKIGKTAYSILAGQDTGNYAGLFAGLCEHFVKLMDTLQSMREINSAQRSLDLLQAAEVWHDTRSQQALRTLQQFTASTYIISSGEECANSRFKH